MVIVRNSCEFTKSKSYYPSSFSLVQGVMCLEQEHYSNGLGRLNLGLYQVQGLRFRRVISLSERDHDEMET